MKLAVFFMCLGAAIAAFCLWPWPKYIQTYKPVRHDHDAFLKNAYMRDGFAEAYSDTGVYPIEGYDYTTAEWSGR